MAYTRVNWEDLPSTNTPINATNLNNMDAGIKENDEKLNGTKPMGSIVVDDVSCKNLFDLSSVIKNAGVNNGVIFSTTGFDIYVIKVVPNQKYTISKTSYNGGLIGYYSTFPAIGNTLTNLQTLRNVTELTITAQDNYLCMMIAQDDNVGTIQVELGETATSYTKGKHIIKEQNGYVKESTTFYANDFKCKNMFDPSSMIELRNQVRRYSDGAVVSVSGYLGLKIPVKPNTTYIISSNLTSRDKISNLCYFNGTTYISGEAFGSGSLSFTTPNNCNYITFALSNEYTWCQLEAGSEATPYTPYKNFDNTPIITQLLSDTSPSAGTSYSLSDNIENYKYIMIVMSSGALFPNSRREYIPVEQLQINSNDYRIGISLFQSATVYMFLDLSFDANNSIRCNTKTQGTTGWSPRLKVYGIK